MKVLFYSIKPYETQTLQKHRPEEIFCKFIGDTLNQKTAYLAAGYDAVCIFVNDDASSGVIDTLFELGIKFIAIRATGYDNVDLAQARSKNIKVVNVPEYSSSAIAEHAVALILTLARKIVIAEKNVKIHNFTVDKLIGFDLSKKTVGIIGVGKIGRIFAKIMHGFGCTLLGNDIKENEEVKSTYNLKYVPLTELYNSSDIISLHTELNPQTKYMIDKEAIELMKKDVMIINTSRGKCVHTKHVIAGLQNNKIGYFGTDVYENEKGIFFYDLSKAIFKDDMLNMLISLPNVIVTPHQAFATNEALAALAKITYENLEQMRNNGDLENMIRD